MIVLEKFEPADYESLISWVDSAETLMQFAGIGFTYPLTKEQLDNSANDKNRYIFKVVDTVSNTTIGHAEIYKTETAGRLNRIIIGDTKFRGIGVGQNVVNQLLDYTFYVLNKPEAELYVFDWNTGALKCYEKVGFVISPHKKVERKINGESWVAVYMLLNKEKWEEQKNKV